MSEEIKQKLANVYNTLATLIPVPSEDFSTKHAFCLQAIRQILVEESEAKGDK